MLEDTFIDRLSRRVRAVFTQHKTEMLVMAGIGFIAGAVLL